MKEAEFWDVLREIGHSMLQSNKKMTTQEEKVIELFLRLLGKIKRKGLDANYPEQLKEALDLEAIKSLIDRTNEVQLVNCLARKLLQELEKKKVLGDHLLPMFESNDRR